MVKKFDKGERGSKIGIFYGDILFDGPSYNQKYSLLEEREKSWSLEIKDLQEIKL